MGYLKVLARARWERKDCFDERYKAIYTISVLKPSFEYPVACVSLSIVKGVNRIFDRFLSVEDIRQFIVIPPDYVERLELAFEEALRQAENIRSQQRVYHSMSKRQNSLVIDPETGEIVAEAERIIKGESRGGRAS